MPFARFTFQACSFNPEYDAPVFFGRDTRYAHRVYGAVIINTVK